MDSRQDGKGYIDDAQPHTPPRAPSPGGSSISEQDSTHTHHSPPRGVPGLVELLGRELERARVDQSSSDESLVDDADDGSDWDPEDEDWELADGDFTKQYNRMRQLHAANDGSSARPIAPARNQVKAAKAPGVAINPKSLDKQKDKSDRATLDQVLDARTRMILSSLVNRGVLGKMDRCISTGKEANVYRADPGASDAFPSLAVKIYRTSILAFRARQSYMEGEHRFRGEYTSAKNPRKMVRVWAEKELRNLKRLEQCGINAPRVVEVKQNVLVMEFLGAEEASPRLKDANLDEADLSRVYIELWTMIRRMFKECRLVHADLSDYHLDHVYIIDVSQSVEEDHPRAFDFLRVDICNMEEYFSKRIKTLGPRRVWDFVVGNAHDGSPNVIQAWLDEPTDPVNDAVFMSSFIPRNLGQVYDPERDIELVNAGKGSELIYADVTGLNDVPDDRPEPDTSDDSDDATDDAKEVHSRGFRHEDRAAKKERKKAVKDEQREKRKTKMPKAEKQRLVRKTARP